MKSSVVRIGIGGPVGSGKTKLVERLLPLMQEAGLRVAVITNDLVTREDAKRIQVGGLIDPDRVIGVETGACPHTAIREDPSVNIEAAERLESRYDLDIILIESGGDNLASTFSRDLVDYWIFVIDCGAGDDIPRKRGLGCLQADLLIVNKIDIAVHVDADIGLIRSDVATIRPDKPSLFTNLKNPEGAKEVFSHLCRALFLKVNDERDPSAVGIPVG